MDFKIAVLAGDGIGPEISVQGVEVMSAVCEKFGHKVSYEYAICGANAIDEVGDPFPEETYQACKNADAVLFLLSATRSLTMILLPKSVRNRDYWQCVRSWDFSLTSVPYRHSNA